MGGPLKENPLRLPYICIVSFSMGNLMIWPNLQKITNPDFPEFFGDFPEPKRYLCGVIPVVFTPRFWVARLDVPTVPCEGTFLVQFGMAVWVARVSCIQTHGYVVFFGMGRYGYNIVEHLATNPQLVRLRWCYVVFAPQPMDPQRYARRSSGSSGSIKSFTQCLGEENLHNLLQISENHQRNISKNNNKNSGKLT